MEKHWELLFSHMDGGCFQLMALSQSSQPKWTRSPGLLVVSLIFFPKLHHLSSVTYATLATFVLSKRLSYITERLRSR